jgi:hypothetical protein
MKRNGAKEHIGNTLFDDRLRLPKTSRTDIHTRLKKKSAWFQSIADPLTGAGTKIPDMNGIETGTIQTVQKISVACNANGVAGLKFDTPYPNSEGAASASANYSTTQAASVPNNLNWLGSLPLDVADTLKANARGVRVVSAAIVAQSELSTLSDQGEMCAFFVPWGPVPVTGNYDDLVKNFGSSTQPLNKHKAMKASWFPTNFADAQGFVYNYDTFFSPNDGVGDPSPLWTFGLCCTGMVASAGNIVFTLIVNYEFIPVLNVIEIVSSAPSPQDEMDESMVMGWVQELPITGTVSDRSIDRAPAPITDKVPETETYGFGMFYEILKEIVPLALSAL